VEPTWYNFADFLTLEFPELRSDIEASYFEWLSVTRDPYPHFFLDEFLIPILIGDGESTARTRAGAILDRLLLSPDEDLAGAALTAVLEPLRDNPELRERAWPFLGETAREWLGRLVDSR